VRGRHGQLHEHQSIPSVIDMDRDLDFVGLQPEMLDFEPVQEALADGGIFVPPAVEVAGEEEVPVED